MCELGSGGTGELPRSPAAVATVAAPNATRASSKQVAVSRVQLVSAGVRPSSFRVGGPTPTAKQPQELAMVWSSSLDFSVVSGYDRVSSSIERVRGRVALTRRTLDGQLAC